MSTPDDDHVERVLAERARLLARPLEEPDRRALDDVVVLEAGGERYAIALTSVERVHPVDAVTVVPGQIRGRQIRGDAPCFLGRGVRVRENFRDKVDQSLNL